MSDSEENDVMSGDEEADGSNEEVCRRERIISLRAVLYCLEIYVIFLEYVLFSIRTCVPINERYAYCIICEQSFICIF